MKEKNLRLCWDKDCPLGKPICCIDCIDNTVCSESCSEPNYCGWIEKEHLMKLDENISFVDARNLMELISTLAKGRAFTKREFLQIVAVCNACVDRLEAEDKQEGAAE